MKATLASTSEGLKVARAGLSALENEKDRLQEELQTVRETLGETVEQLRSQSAEYCKLKVRVRAALWIHCGSLSLRKFVYCH